jgi:uncharacterized protein (TIGR02453 family)
MSHFDKDFVKFFKDLSANNNRDWFHANKKRYEASVKNPFAAFVQEMIDRMGKDDKSVKIEPKEAIFRINRDVRFSKDKSPYKLNVSAIIGPGGKKDKTTPGVYLQLGAEDVRMYGGLHATEKEELYRVREYLSKNLKGFDKVLNDKKFKSTFGEIHGEKNKRLPSEFMEAADKQPLIYNKGWYYFTKMKPSVVTDPNFCDMLMEQYMAAKPMKEFLTKALGR